MLNAHELKRNMNWILWETSYCIINHDWWFLFLLFCAYFDVYSQTDYWKLYVTTILQLFFRQLKNDQGLFLITIIYIFSHFPD